MGEPSASLGRFLAWFGAKRRRRQWTAAAGLLVATAALVVAVETRLEADASQAWLGLDHRVEGEVVGFDGRLAVVRYVELDRPYQVAAAHSHTYEPGDRVVAWLDSEGVSPPMIEGTRLSAYARVAGSSGATILAESAVAFMSFALLWLFTLALRGGVDWLGRRRRRPEGCA